MPALCVGLNYCGTDAALVGSATDAQNMATVAHGMGIEEVSTLTDTDGPVSHADIVCALRQMVANAQPGDDLLFSFAGAGAAGEGNFIQASDGPVTEAEIRDILAALPEGAKFTMAVDSSASDVAADIDLSCINGAGSVVCIASGTTGEPASVECGSTFTSSLVSVLGENPGITWSEAAALADPSGNATVAATQTELIYSPAFSSDSVAADGVHAAVNSDDLIDQTVNLRLNPGTTTVTRLDRDGDGVAETVVTRDTSLGVTITDVYGRSGHVDNRGVEFDDGTRIAQADYNADGVMDVSATYRNGKLVESRADNDLDGKIDYRMTTDANGTVVNTTDMNEDGFAEQTTIVTNQDGVTINKYDFDSDGKINTAVYRDASGTAYAEHDLNGDGVADATTTYRNGQLVAGELDTNGDGVLDTVVVHNAEDGLYYVSEDTDLNGDFETARGPDTNGLANVLDSIGDNSQVDVGQWDMAA
ncbi:Ca(2+)-dependent cysteine protease [Blastocladiella emersonii ATCC 22665]|nr:Ca(2+)-dependent cysteine protease [Blastocladiella emersonii ATCC 22665]